MCRFETILGVVMKAIYENCTDKYIDLAAEVMNQRKDLQPLLESGANIGFIESTERKKSNGKVVFADTRLVSGIWTAFCHYDFIITFYIPHVDLLDVEQEKILMWHELKHCGVKENGKLYIVPHDIEDFRTIIEKHGLDWANIG